MSLLSLSEQDVSRLKEYVEASDALALKEPPMYINPELDKQTNPAWEAWNKECISLDERYSDAIIRAIQVSLKNEDIGTTITVDLVKGAIEAALTKGPQQIEGQTSIFPEPRISNRKAAQLAGALMGVGGRQLSITDRKYQFALTPRRNSIAFISVLDAELMEQMVFEGGKLNLLKSGMEPATIKRKTRDGLKTVKELDLPLLRQLCTAAYTTAKSADINTITVYLPAFCKEMGIDMQGGKPVDLFGKLEAFNHCIGVFEDGSYWKLFELLGYDKEKNTLTFATPYINRLFLAIARNNTKQLKSGKTYETPAYSLLMHSTTASERNKAAVEIANRLITGLQQRGHVPDAELKQNKGAQGIEPGIVTYSVSFSTIIDDIPLLRDRLDAAKSTQQKNQTMRRAFTGAYKILKTKTDAYKYYINLSIPEIVPTVTTIDNLLRITHYGKNGKYKAPKHGELN